MKDWDEKVICGDFKAVRKITALTGIEGEWMKTNNHCQYRTTCGAVLNYWKSTGRITFQGSKFAAAELRAMFLKRAVIIQER